MVYQSIRNLEVSLLPLVMGQLEPIPLLVTQTRTEVKFRGTVRIANPE